MSSDDIDYSQLPPPSSVLHEGHTFTHSNLFSLLDSFHLPIALIDSYNGNWVEVIWINKKHVEVLGENSREYYLKKLNKKLPTATDTFKKRLMMWKEKVQIKLGYHTDPHKLFPDSGPPIPHFTRMLPVNVDLGDRAGVFNLAVHIPEDSYNTNALSRASDAFKYCPTMVSMMMQSGETVWMNSSAEKFFTTGVGVKVNKKNRLKHLLENTVKEIEALKVAIEGNDDNTTSRRSSVGVSMSSASSTVSSDSASKSTPFDSMTKKVFEDGETYETTVKLSDDIFHKLVVTLGIDPVSGEKVAVVCQDDVSNIRQVQKAAIELEDMNNRKDMLFANMSHELKTPLNGIIALTEVLIEDLEPTIDKSSMSTLKNILISGQRLNSLVTNLLDASLLKNKQLSVKMTDDIKLHPLVDNILVLARSVIANTMPDKKGLLLVNKVLPSFKTFKCDENRLSQIISNLVNNAIKFTPSGTVSVAATIVQNEHEEGIVGDFIKLDIIDTGIGIDKKNQKKIFESLRQVEESADRMYGGTGLGLAIAKDLAIAMGGGIDLASKLGRGSKFTVKIPFYEENKKLPVPPLPSSRSSIASTTSSASGTETITAINTFNAKSSSCSQSSEQNTSLNRVSGPFGRQRRATIKSAQDITGIIEILSIDDEPTNQVVVEAALRKRSYKITRCMSGLEAIQILQKRKETSSFFPDLILLDVMMPKMNGFETCKQIRDSFPLACLPIIMVSAKNKEENIVQGLSCGANDYITKPFSKLELTARIDTQLHLRSSWLAELEAEKAENLLHQMLPDHIVDILKHTDDDGDKHKKSKYIANSHDNVVILFSDIVGFTSLSSKVPTIQIIEMLSEMFSAFDALTTKHNVYKVETIGDAYMVAAGHLNGDDPVKSAAKVMMMARGMLEVMEDLNESLGHLLSGSDGTKAKLEIRIGIHCGPAHTGVVGTKMPRFCFFGDTVNTASRMESNGFPSCIHVSEAYQEATKGIADYELYGSREIKGKGSMNTYLCRFGKWEEALREKEEGTLATKPRAESLTESYNRAKFRRLSLGGGAEVLSGVDLLGQRNQENRVKELEQELARAKKSVRKLKKENAILKRDQGRSGSTSASWEDTPPRRNGGSGVGGGLMMSPDPLFRGSNISGSVAGGGGGMGGDVVVKLGANPKFWDDAEVSFWLCWKSVFLGSKYCGAFRECGVNGEMLLKLTDQDLKEHLGVQNEMHRRRILQEIERLKQNLMRFEEMMEGEGEEGEESSEEEGSDI